MNETVAMTIAAVSLARAVTAVAMTIDVVSLSRPVRAVVRTRVDPIGRDGTRDRTYPGSDSGCYEKSCGVIR